MNSLLKIDFNQPLNPRGLQALREYVGDDIKTAAGRVRVSPSTWLRWESGAIRRASKGAIELYLWKTQSLFDEHTTERRYFDVLANAIIRDDARPTSAANVADSPDTDERAKKGRSAA